MKSIPIALRKDYNYYYELSKFIVKNSWSVPLQNTMFGLDLDLKYWQRAKDIQLQKEALVLKLASETGQYIYHNRYYSDFDMWLRAKEDWKDLVVSLFFNKKPIISKYIDEAHIINTINQHFNAEGSYHSDIVKWVSVELFLNLY